MPGYLEDYGVGDAQRERKQKIIIFSSLGALIVGGLLYANFRDYKEEQLVKQFVRATKSQDFKAAYTFWGCTPEAPCRDYPYTKFLEDWGPQGVNAKFVNGGSFTETERCGTGFIASMNSGKEDLALWVERANGVVSYAPWSVCPEKKLRLMKWLKMKFGS